MKCKKLVSMFLVVFMLVSIALIQTINVSADSSGAIYVSSYPDLVNMMKNPGGSYILLKDIKINNADNFNVQNFSGIFDGNGHSISFSNSREGGFVEVLEKGATIKNLHVYISAATGTDNVGIIAGTSYGTMANCWVSGYVSASGINCGGLVGKLSGGSVSDCYSLATVSGTSIYGGLIGAAENASVERCYVSASIEGSRAEAGSFLGSNSSSSINNCYYNSSKNGAFLGVGIGSDTVTAKTSEEMKSAETFAGFDFSNTWVHIDGEFPKLVCYNGKGTSDNPYKIHTNDELISIIQPYLGDAGTGRYYQLAANIKNYSGPSLGDDNSRFTGFFDGNGYVFYNTNISSGGIFYSVAENAVVKNVVFDGYNFSGGGVAGAVASINHGTIDNCHVGNGTISGSKDLGGIVWENINGTVTNCSFTGDINGRGSGIGGIVGYNSYGTISNCAVYSGTIRSSDHSVGGVVGDNSNGLAENCFSLASVNTSTSESGGVAGRLYNGVIRNSYSNAGVYGNDLNSIGGIVGSIIEDGVVENCLYNKELVSVLIGGTEDKTGGISADELKNAYYYSGFDFTSVWTVDESGECIVLSSISGKGTKENPYLIRTSSDWIRVGIGIKNSGERNYYKIMNDLFSVRALGQFCGSLDGGGHEVGQHNGNLITTLNPGGYIGNLTVSGIIVETVDKATIEHCTVYNSNVSYFDGGFVNKNLGGKISDCSVIDSTISLTDITGGFVGQNSEGGVINNCYIMNCKVSGNSIAGGFVGNNTNGTIENCYVYDTVVSAPSTVGGMAGRNDNNGKINNCYTGASVSEANYAGAFVGMNYAAISSSYANGGYSAGNAVPAVKFAGLNEGNITGENLDFSGNTLPYKYIQTSGLNISVNDTTVYTPQTPDVTPGRLTDISGHWAEQTIRNLVSKNVVNGYEDGTFRPEDSVTKGEFIKLLMSATGKGTSDGFTNYKDVNASWARPYVSKAIYLGICDNISDSTEIFGVDKSITRAQAVALMGRLLAPDKTGIPSFTDNSSIPDWASNEVYSMVELGLITGMEDGSFKPLDNLTRAEAATIIERIMNLG